MSDLEKASRSRRQMLDTARALLAGTEQLVAERGPLLKGAYQLRGTRCGKPTCKCARGELHPTAVLVVSQDGRRRSYYVRPAERAEVQQRVARYLHYRGEQATLTRLTVEVMAAADELLAALLEPHQPLRAADPPQRARRRTHTR